MTQDEEHLRLLAIFHFVLAGVLCLVSLAPVLHLVLGLAIVTGALDTDKGPEIPLFVGWLFLVFSVCFIAFCLTSAVLIALAGRALGRRRSYTFCLAIAGLSCVFMPLGTVLGVFTIIVLMRDSVRALFGRTL